MLTISDYQFSQLQAFSKRQFIKRLSSYFTDKFPESSMNENINTLVERAWSYHLVTENDIKDFVEFFFVYHEFDVLLSNSRCLEFLESPDFDGAYKLELMYHEFTNSQN